MILPSPEDVIRQELESEDPLFMTTEELVEKYGLPKTVNCLEEASKLIKSGVTQMRFLSVISSDELSEDGHYHDFAMSGIHIVNVVERYVFEKELPQNLFIEDFDYGAVEGEKRTVMVQFTESFTYKKRIPYIEGMNVAKIIEGLNYENDELADHNLVIDSVDGVEQVGEAGSSKNAWIVVEIEDGCVEGLMFAGFDYEKANKILKQKYCDHGTWNEAQGEVDILIDEKHDHRITLMPVSVDPEVAVLLDIEQNYFQFYSDIPGLVIKGFYADGEFSKLLKMKNLPLHKNKEMLYDTVNQERKRFGKKQYKVE